MKKVLSAFAVLTAASSLFAYNPPTGSEDLNRLSEPELLSGGHSSAGGALYFVTPSSIVNNPALPALEQRIMIDLGYTALIDSDDLSDDDYGNSAGLGVSIPSRYGVTTFLAQWIASPFLDMHLGHVFDFRGNFSKDITDNLNFGATANVGVAYDEKSDWKAGIDVGILYNFGKIAFMDDFRLGVALMNLGKPFSGDELLGMSADSRDENHEDWEDNEATMYPGLATLRVGVASTLFEAGLFKGGWSADVSVPTAQNAVFDAGFQVSYAEMVRLNVGWNANLREMIEGRDVNLPSIGLSFKFAFQSSKLAAGNSDWGQSEMTVGAAWQQLYKNVTAVSGGALLKLGTSDNEPPEITLWAEDGKSDKKNDKSEKTESKE